MPSTEAPTISTLKCDLIWKQDHYRHRWLRNREFLLGPEFLERWSEGRNKSGCGEGRKHEKQRECSHLQNAVTGRYPNAQEKLTLTNDAYSSSQSSAKADSVGATSPRELQQGADFYHFLNVQIYQQAECIQTGTAESQALLLGLMATDESYQKAREMAQRVNPFATKTVNQSSFPQAHTMEGPGLNQLPSVVYTYLQLCLVHTVNR